MLLLHRLTTAALTAECVLCDFAWTIFTPTPLALCSSSLKKKNLLFAIYVSEKHLAAFQYELASPRIVWTIMEAHVNYSIDQIEPK